MKVQLRLAPGCARLRFAGLCGTNFAYPPCPFRGCELPSSTKSLNNMRGLAITVKSPVTDVPARCREMVTIQIL